MKIWAKKCFCLTKSKTKNYHKNLSFFLKHYIYIYLYIYIYIYIFYLHNFFGLSLLGPSKQCCLRQNVGASIPPKTSGKDNCQEKEPIEMIKSLFCIFLAFFLQCFYYTKHMHVNYFITDICFTKLILCFIKRGICCYQTEQLTRPCYMFA